MGVLARRCTVLRHIADVVTLSLEVDGEGLARQSSAAVGKAYGCCARLSE